jgi:hypothetical protein
MSDDLPPTVPFGAFDPPEDPRPGPPTAPPPAPGSHGSFPPAVGLPLYAPPPPPPAPPRRRLSPKVAGLLVGVVALIGASVFAVTALDQPDGASSPEAAVHQLFDAISHRDALGVIESLPANERDVLRQPAIDITQELQRLGILSSTFHLDNVPGAQLSVDNLQLTSDDLGPGVVRVNVVGGTISGHSIPSELPIGDRLHAIMAKDFGNSSVSTKPSSFSNNLSDSHLRLVTVKDGGGWHVSLGYTIADAIHGDRSTPPDFAAAPAPVGSATPDGAVRDLVSAATALDARRVVTLMAPDEDKALYAYASLFLPAVGSSSRSNGTTIKVSRLDLTVEGSGTTRRVHLGGFAGTFEDQDQTTQVSFDGRCMTSQMTYKNAAVGIGGTDQAAADAADQAQYADPSGPGSSIPPDPGYQADLQQERAQAQKPQKSCTGQDPSNATGTSGVGSLGVLGTATNQLAITVVQVDGRWYVSPVRTLLDTVVSSLQHLKPSDVDKWGSWFSNFGDPCSTTDSGSSNSSSSSTTQTTDASGSGVQTCSRSSDTSSSSSSDGSSVTPAPFATIPAPPSGATGTGGSTVETLPGVNQTITLPDGTTLGPDGTITEPDGTVIKTTDPGWSAAMQRLAPQLAQMNQNLGGAGGNGSGSPATSVPVPPGG